jgi:hypothetical protein
LKSDSKFDFLLRLFRRADFSGNFNRSSLRRTRRLALVLAATIIYLIGNFGVTVFGNVPMNNTLDRFDLKTATTKKLPGKKRV